jgi:hypothetical protein
MHEAAVKEVVRRCVRVCFIETPSWIAFRIGTDDRYGEEGLQVLDVPDQVGAVGEGAEEAFAFQLAFRSCVLGIILGCTDV